ncbi:ubiquitin carboxyl-terminal hydrolase 2 isoform X1 [Anoplophora glabripennis]|uniref:ubiquitin carboxyl-terminal hydrolase 2 isoform X1 n=1 Tax=Anoplophora glabripennis TaxID=217634 RepID=UPI0008755F43|nr:ubiquitin carboxyl-terminal hydrolase 2 isoform X1 [Anoplophora glabripennis]
MPVLSPHRSSASGLSGSYRSNFSSSALDRPYFSPSSYSPRITSYSERYTTRAYTDSDGRRIFSRSGSITEDGVTTRFREESREPSVRRDSIGRDSGISSIRENSISDYPRRDSSLSRNDRLSTLNVIDSVAELRNKYSPANYVPACLRKNENISRSKSINDIGLPPLEAKTNNKKKVNDRGDAVFSTTNNVLNSNNTNNADDLSDEDDNGNRASVAELCRKFDEKPPKTVKNGTSANKTAESKLKKHDDTSTAKLTNGKAKIAKRPSNSVSAGKKIDNLTSGKCQSNTDVLQSNTKLEVNEEDCLKNGSDVKGDEDGEEVNGTPSRSSSRVNNFASYIPTKDYQKGDESKGDGLSLKENAKNDMDNKDNYAGKILQNDLAASPKLNRNAVSPSNSIPSSLNSLSRRSSDRDSHRARDILDDDSGGERNTIRPFNSTKVLGLNGLKNIGNTCFMNSVIQCLSNTRWLLEYLRKDSYIRDINTTISGMKGALIKAFAEVIKELWSEDSSDRVVVNTVSLKSQIQRFAPRFMGYAQQDAQEFLRYLLEGLHEDVNRVTEKPKPILTEIDEKLSDHEKAQESWQRYLRMDNSKIVDHFVGQLKSTLKCTYCGHCSVTFDPFWDLSLPIPQRTGQLRLSQCLDSFTREETLDGDEKPTCSKCKERRKCTKSFSIHKFPKILVIHLKRFSPTERFRGKLNVTVDFPIEGLDMSNYAADNIAPCRYNLYAISNHSGTTYSGHYTAYCRHPYAGTWHEYNDSRVSPISPKSLVSGEAYVLFYEQEGAKSHL